MFDNMNSSCSFHFAQVHGCNILHSLFVLAASLTLPSSTAHHMVIARARSVMLYVRRTLTIMSVTMHLSWRGISFHFPLTSWLNILHSLCSYNLLPLTLITDPLSTVASRGHNSCQTCSILRTVTIMSDVMNP